MNTDQQITRKNADTMRASAIRARSAFSDARLGLIVGRK